MADIFERLQSALPDRYAVVREVGRGGMATVYLAEDLKHSRQVAVKVLHPDLASILGRTRFLREIEIAASLAHPGIIPLYDSGVTDDVTFYVMPYVDGESLRERLDRDRQLPLEDALRIAREVGDALSHAHAHQIIHRDIKPANILLSEGHALVADFGIARAITAAGGEQITTSGLAVGTPAYMSPEQASAKDPVDQRADIYALGCVVYEMLAGEPPFTGATAQAVLARHRLERPPALEVVRPGVGHGVQHVVDKALAKAPADRYQTVEEFLAELEKAAKAPESGEYLPPPPPVPLPAPRWKRTPIVIAASVTIVAAGVVAVWTPWAPTRRLDPNKVMVFPLRGTGGVTREATQQVFTVVENALVHTDPLHWSSGERYLSAAAAGQGDVDVGTAMRLARRQGAGHWMTGTVALAGDSLAVALELYDVRGESLVVREPVTGAASVPAYALALRAMNAVLPKLVGRSTHVDQALLEGFAPRAVVHWLAGEQAYREARYDSALAQYEQALALDSGMVFAALRAAMTAAWALDAEGYARGAELVRIALAHENRLPRRNAAYAHGLAFLFEGDGDSAVAWFRRAVAADSGWSEGWYGVGEAYFHLAPSGRAQDSLARDAFARALTLDPDFAPVTYHLAEIALLVGDRRAADSLVRRHARLSRDSAQLVTLDILDACIASGPGAVAWRGLAERYPNEVLDAGRLFAGGARYPRCARAAMEAAFRSPAPDPLGARVWSSSVGLHHLALFRGDTAWVRRFVDSVTVARGRLSWSVGGFRVFDAVADAMPDAFAQRTVSGLDVPLAPASAEMLEWIGWWATHTGSAARLDSIATLLARHARAGGGAFVRVAADAMAAWSALRAGDTVTALVRFGALRPVAGVGELAFGIWEPLALERITYARVLFAKGQYAKAIEVAASFDRGLSLADLVFLPASLEMRREAAERLGERTLARDLERRLRALRAG